MGLILNQPTSVFGISSWDIDLDYCDENRLPWKKTIFFHFEVATKYYL